MITRRKFIQTTALTTIGSALLPGMLKAAPARQNVGIQLYTVRDHISQDLEGTLRKLRKIGYTWVEAAGYGDGKFYNLSPAEFKKMVEKMGMKVVSSHVTFNADKQKQAIEAHAELGVDYVVFPVFPIPERKTEDDFKRAAARLNAIGEACNKSNLRFGYHNHDFEFAKFNGTRGYDLLLNLTDQEKVTFECDIYWMKYAGIDPVAYFEKYPGRFRLWHVKDMNDSPEKGFTEVGEGIIPYAEYKNYMGLSGMEYFFVEQDECDKDPLLSAEISFQNLYNILYGE
jgi:sugar phosphate isomerase/epimerase